jgi:hypothetical protein
MRLTRIIASVGIGIKRGNTDIWLRMARAIHPMMQRGNRALASVRMPG